MSFNKEKVIPYILIWFVSAAAGSYLRMQPLITHRSFDASEKATLFVLRNVRKKVIESINKNFPNLPTDKKNELIKKNVDAILRKQGHMVLKTIDHVSKNIDKSSGKEFQYPYLLASDSFYYYSLTENILNTGKISDTIKGSKYLNKQMLAPEGHWEPFNLHPFVGYAIYRILSLFNNDIPLIFAISFTPVIIIALALIPFLLICSLQGCSRLVSLVSAVFFVSAPSLIKRSAFGWYDNDPYNTLFPFLILLSVLLGLKEIKNFRKGMLFAVLTFGLITVYSLFWQGWVFLLSIICVAGFFIIIINHFFLREKGQTKPLGIYFATILGGTLLGIGVVFGPKEFFILFKEGWVALKDFISPQLALWPDLYLSVGELRRPPLDVIIHFVGGIPFFGCAVLGLIVRLIDVFREREAQTAYQIILIGVLLICAFVLTLGAQRFILLLLIPSSLLFPIGLQFLFHQIDLHLLKRLPRKIHNHTASLIGLWVLVIFCLVLFVQMKYKTVPRFLNKIYNSTWEDALIKIRDATPQDAIINTWWPPGHFIKAVAKRRVTFDGATINKPQGYWMASVFLSRDEREVLGLLRMLNNSANQATEYLTENGIKLSKAIETLKTISQLNDNQAKWEIKRAFNLEDSQISHLLELTHRKPPPSYLLIFNELVEKNTQFKFVGGWNFKKMEEINESPGRLKLIPPHRSPRYIEFLWNLAGGPYRYSNIFGQLSSQGSTLTFEQNIKIDYLTKDVHIDSKKYGRGVPRSIFYLKDENVVEKKFPNATLPYSIILFKDFKEYKCVLLDRPLAQSVLMHLYFFKGKGLKYLKPFAQESDLTQRTQIYLFEVDWDKFFTDLATEQSALLGP